jgi:glycosyltransferase involved in cell wall biosynthesis
VRVLQVDLGSPALGADGIPVAIASVAAPLAALGVESVLRKTPLVGLRESLREAGATAAIVRAEAFDVVHLHSVFRPAHVRLAVALRRLGVPYVVSPHSGLAAPALRRDALRKRVWIAAFERRYLAGAARVVCLSPVEAADVLQVSPRARPAVVPNAMPGSDAEVTWSPVSPPELLTLARYDVRQKGLDRLVALARHCPGVTFSVYGDRDHNEGELVDQLLADLPANVRFLPPISGSDKAVALAGASAYFAPSRWEGLSMSILEALRAGVPCVTSGYAASTLGAASSHVLAIPDEILDGDPAEAARLVSEAIGDPERLAAIGDAGRTAVRDEFEPSAVARRLADLYASTA